jgi:hypothetical protein
MHFILTFVSISNCFQVASSTVTVRTHASIISGPLKLKIKQNTATKRFRDKVKGSILLFLGQCLDIPFALTSYLLKQLSKWENENCYRIELFFS